MSKALKPSGYQIININLTDINENTPFDPRTEDEQTLLDILVDNKEIPILATITGTPLGYTWVGMPVHNVGNSISFTCGILDAQIFVLISLQQDESGNYKLMAQWSEQ